MLKTAEPRLRKTLITNFKKDFVNCICECLLNVLNSNIKLSGCNTRNLKKHKTALRKVADRHISLFGKKRLIVQRAGFLLPLLGAILPTIASLIFKQRYICYLRCTTSQPITTLRGTNDVASRLASVRNVSEGDVKTSST